MATKGSMDDILERNPECRSQSGSFMDAFTQHALNSARFVRLLAKYIRKNLNDQVEFSEQKEEMTDSA